MRPEIRRKIIYFSGLGSTFIFLLFVAAGLHLNTELSNLVESASIYFLVLFILLLSFLMHDLFIYFIDSLKERFYKKRYLQELEEKLARLSTNEKYILSLFVTEQKVERTLDQNEPAVAWLESLKIIFNTGRSVEGKRFIYKISPLPMRILSQNPNWLH